MFSCKQKKGENKKQFIYSNYSFYLKFALHENLRYSNGEILKERFTVLIYFQVLSYIGN